MAGFLLEVDSLLTEALGSFTHWPFAALLTMFYPKMVSAFAPGTLFVFFCAMMMLQLIWVKLMVPETKGVSLEEIEHRLTCTTSPHSLGHANAIPSPSTAGRTS